MLRSVKKEKKRKRRRLEVWQGRRGREERRSGIEPGRERMCYGLVLLSVHFWTCVREQDRKREGDRSDRGRERES